MRIAYLILTHENPRLLQRMINVLSFRDPDCGFFIHLDSKTAFGPFSSVRGQNVRFLGNRIPVFWGEYSQVEATLALIREAIGGSRPYDYYVLISGSCYPLRTGGYIRKFFEAHRGLEYMDIVRVPGPGKPISRFNTIRYPSGQPVRRFLFRALAKVGLAQRDHRKSLYGLDPYSGAGLWALTHEACRYVLDFVASHPGLENYFQHTFASDEAFFHTILGNSVFRDRMRRNLVYAVWPGPVNGHPAPITEKDLNFFETHDEVCREDLHGPGELLFARKFYDRDLDMLTRIEAMIERKESVQLLSSIESFGATRNIGV